MSSYYPNQAESNAAFYRARKRARFDTLFSKFNEQRLDALNYSEIMHKLHGKELSKRQLESVNLDHIVGSVGRYKDFTYNFMPKSNSDLHRWRQIHMLASGSARGFPPIELFRIGDYYFVRDGNHRVSVARHMGLVSIEAYVTDVVTKVPFNPSDNPDEIIIKSELADFLSKTHLDDSLPEADVILTAPGNYQLLLEHIEVHRYFLSEDSQHYVSYVDAAASWYRQVYLPIKALFKKNLVLKDFHHRTYLDLYVWLARHREWIEDQLSWKMDDDRIIQRLAKNPSLMAPRDTLYADSIRELGYDLQLAKNVMANKPVINDILFVLTDWTLYWSSLTQAIILAQKFNAKIYAILVVADKPNLNSPKTQQTRQRMLNEAAAAKVEMQVAVDSKSSFELIREREGWTDIVVVHPQTLCRRETRTLQYSRLRSFIRHSSSMVLLCGDEAKEFHHVVLGLTEKHLKTVAYLATQLAPALDCTFLLKPLSYIERIRLKILHKTGKILSKHKASYQHYDIDLLPSNTDLYVISAYNVSRWQLDFFHDQLDKALLQQSVPVLVVK